MGAISPEILIEQALYGNPGSGGYRFLARSAGFVDDWLGPAEKLCTSFGDRPAGVRCPGCVFAQPFGNQHVAIVQVADLGTDDAGRPGALGFRLLIVARTVYVKWLGDPFQVADQFAPPWHVRGTLPTLTFSMATHPRRTVADVQQVLQRSDGPVLLGGTQGLVDGARLIFERPGPDEGLLRGLWTLLPASSRCHLWPASFAFNNNLGFDALVVPRLGTSVPEGYLSEEQAGDYPEGRYELNLQIAAEAGDQDELDLLFARRSHAQVWRMGLVLLAVILVLMVAMRLLQAPRPARPRQAERPAVQQQESPVTEKSVSGKGESR